MFASNKQYIAMYAILSERVNAYIIREQAMLNHKIHVAVLTL